MPRSAPIGAGGHERLKRTESAAPHAAVGDPGRGEEEPVAVTCRPRRRFWSALRKTQRLPLKHGSPHCGRGQQSDALARPGLLRARPRSLHGHPNRPGIARVHVAPVITSAHRPVGTRIVRGRVRVLDGPACAQAIALPRLAHAQRDRITVGGALALDEASRLCLTIRGAAIAGDGVAVVAGFSAVDVPLASLGDTDRGEVRLGAAACPQHAHERVARWIEPGTHRDETARAAWNTPAGSHP